MQFKYMLFASNVQQGVVMSICGRPTTNDDDVKVGRQNGK